MCGAIDCLGTCAFRQWLNVDNGRHDLHLFCPLLEVLATAHPRNSNLSCKMQGVFFQIVSQVVQRQCSEAAQNTNFLTDFLNII